MMARWICSSRVGRGEMFALKTFRIASKGVLLSSSTLLHPSNSNNSRTKCTDFTEIQLWPAYPLLLERRHIVIRLSVE
jgi:hypothetical protein